jgi:2-amino-4-hydroxy-6-hydroxymethyldihydropteridine diphosphokinase
MASASTPFLYVIALGSNRCHGRFGRPSAVIDAAVDAMACEDVAIVSRSPTLSSRPIGPSLRDYANAACLISTSLEPLALLALLKRLERRFGRRAGQRWGSRVLDLDIILWSGGRWQSPSLTIPHRLWQQRSFVTKPLLAIVPDWRDPVARLTVRHIAARSHSAKRRIVPVDPSRKRA